MIVTVVLFAAGGVVVYGLLCWSDPFPVCPPVVKTKLSRPRRCPRCQGTGFRRRAGATLVHGLVWQLRGARSDARQPSWQGPPPLPVPDEEE